MAPLRRSGAFGGGGGGGGGVGGLEHLFWGMNREGSDVAKRL